MLILTRLLNRMLLTSESRNAAESGFHVTVEAGNYITVQCVETPDLITIDVDHLR